jgi:uncharacterized iron-regulated membrane protein
MLWAITGIYFAFPAPFNALTEAFTDHGAETAASLRLEDALSWLVRLHFGRSFGLGVEVAWALLGLVPCGLLVTGLVMWWHRVVRPRSPCYTAASSAVWHEPESHQIP